MTGSSKNNDLKWYDSPTSPAEVVLTSELGPILMKFQEDWYRDRPKDHSPNGISHSKQADHFMGAFQVLQERSGIDQSTISKYANQKVKRVALVTADKLLQAMNLPHYLHNGRVNPIPNPAWSQERWVEYMSERGCI